jgi:DNA-directed RNA polymerase subunit K/omega
MEIDAISSTVRDDTGMIIDKNHQTLPILTKYERTRVLGERAKQINNGAKPYVDVLSSIIDLYIIAEQ